MISRVPPEGPMMRNQEGIMLLEALIGILIFTIGILAMVAMQANALSHVANAQYRSEAASLADEILGQIQADRKDINLTGVDTYAYPGAGSSNPTMVRWLGRVNRLPGSIENPPTVTISTINAAGLTGPTKQVTVVIRWKAPTATNVSNHTAIGYASDQ